MAMAPIPTPEVLCRKPALDAGVHGTATRRSLTCSSTVTRPPRAAVTDGGRLRGHFDPGHGCRVTQRGAIVR